MTMFKEDYIEDRRFKKIKEKRMEKEKREGGFKCCHCGGWTEFSEFMGTEHRNHCPFCLWSKHVDLNKPGDRKAECHAGMRPIGLTFKQEGIDKYGKQRQGEVMLIHECTGCGKININRLAAEDNSQKILELLEESKEFDPEKVEQIRRDGIGFLTEKDKKEVYTQLFGKTIE